MRVHVFYIGHDPALENLLERAAGLTPVQTGERQIDNPDALDPDKAAAANHRVSAHLNERFLAFEVEGQAEANELIRSLHGFPGLRTVPDKPSEPEPEPEQDVSYVDFTTTPPHRWRRMPLLSWPLRMPTAGATGQMGDGRSTPVVTNVLPDPSVAPPGGTLANANSALPVRTVEAGDAGQPQRFVKLYPCGCNAGPGPQNLPDYCPEHGKPEETAGCQTIPFVEQPAAGRTVAPPAIDENRGA